MAEADALAANALTALRLDLTNHGVRLSDDLLASGFALGLATDGRSGGAEGIDLILPGNRWVNVSVAAGYAQTSPFLLLATPAGMVLRHPARGDLPVGLPDTARFRHARTASGRSCGDIGAIHGPWLVTAPFAADPTQGLDQPQRFLGLPTYRAPEATRWSVDEVVACAQKAHAVCGISLIHLEVGEVWFEDGGLAAIAPYITALKRALRVLISVTALPPARPEAVRALYKSGCDALAYHLLAWDATAAAAAAPQRNVLLSHDRVLAGLRAAAACFPRGAVSTDLLVGLEPLASAELGLEALTAQGIVPNLAVFRPLPGAEKTAPAGEMVATGPLLTLMDHRRVLIQRHGLWHSRVRGFPRTLAGVERYAPTWQDRLYCRLQRLIR
jgi:hypothetical protein